MQRKRLEIGFWGADGAERPHLSVDGMTPVGPNLSHWPGNRTPRRYKADLSTGICLNFVRDSDPEQRRFLGDAEFVLNDHYDTDGFLSMLAVIRPEFALAREELCLAAAATGDFQSFQTPRGFAVDRIVANLAAPESPLEREFTGLADTAKALARYRWLIANAEQVLDAPDTLAPVWSDELRAVLDELTRARGGGVDRQLLPLVGLSIVTSRAPLRRLVLNTLAGAYRVLHAQDTTDGTLYRYHDRTESWFEVATFSPLPRTDLRPLADRLQEMEGTTDNGARWCADPPTDPVPELWFGADEPQAYGQVTRSLAPSRLHLRQIQPTLLAHLAFRGGPISG